jgi:bidirectional [NiFe] hydrogenase diaphorase subunit
MTVYTLTIDGRDVAGSEGQSIMDVAEENGIDIPGLCHLPGIHDRGACRLCVVKIAGSPRLAAACVTRIAEGMAVTAHDEELEEYRRAATEMLFLERNHVCAVCVANNHCELQDLSAELGVTHFEMPRISPKVGVDLTHKMFGLDHNRCILCLRCVRVCDEIEGAHTWDVDGRGAGSRVISDLAQPWGQSESCTACGKCVQVCPTGALYEKAQGPGGLVRHRDFLRVHLAREQPPWLP